MSANLNITKEEAQGIMDQFFSRLPSIKNWIESQHQFLARNGFVETPFGRKRYLPDIFSRDRAREEGAKRRAINTPIQSTASDITLLTIITFYRMLKESNLDARIVGTVHDSIPVEVKEEDAEAAVALFYKAVDKVNASIKKIFALTPMVASVELGPVWSEVEDAEVWLEKKRK